MTTDKARSGPKPISAAAALLGAAVAKKALNGVWRLATGKKPPEDPKHPSVAWGEALTWAAVSGAVLNLARLGAQKKVAQTFARTPAGDTTDDARH